MAKNKMTLKKEKRVSCRTSVETEERKAIPEHTVKGKTDVGGDG